MFILTSERNCQVYKTANFLKQTLLYILYFVIFQARSTIFNPDYASVEVSVSDQNDNRPIFKPDRYDASITESAKVGTTLFRVSATDKDEVR